MDHKVGKQRRRVPREKVARACQHCKAAHVTCEAKRPCKRCVKKGLGATCIDAPRKHRKYLEEETRLGSEEAVRGGVLSPGGHAMTASVSTSSLEFQSAAVALEHARLRDLTRPRPVGAGLFEAGFKPHVEDEGDSPGSGFSAPQQKSATPEGDAFHETHLNQYFIGTMDSMDGRRTYTFSQVVEELAQFKEMSPSAFRARNKRSCISFSIGVIDQGGDMWGETIKSVLGTPCGLQYSSPAEIYSKIDTPFLYVEAYHDLNVYLRKRFPREALIQMSRSMTEYRPSFIASTVRLKEQDLVFAEQCFQRTLLEYDEYIGLSGTPTIVWRRSSQIAYVSEEFTILTGWTRHHLLDKSTFVVEIMDDASCVEYFRLFSKLAYGDFKGATMTECTLATPQGRGIRTACTWTLKRDVFGIPMMIIGSFLPILT